ncbi:zinc metallochaperone AztD [Nocardiopsis kunsanensis]|uniref:zinc metallochaperone AztD n=1 Tax=Nocardiopsis kunsanensis TaxID=141693 RepID=UPI00034B4E66|nr:zinc metallochaperone AztD [Nocardiopsis kunsanensis]
MFTPRHSGTAVLAASALLLTACGGDGTDGATQADAGADVTDPVVTTYDGGILVLDGSTLEVEADIELEGFNRLNPAGDGRHLLVSTSQGFQVLDAVAGELTDTVFEAETPGHVVVHEGRTALFDDGTGEITVFDSDAAGEVTPDEADTHSAGEPHHGVAVELSSGQILHTLGDEEEVNGVVVLGPDGEEVARTEECPGVHGETVAEEETVVIGCQDGALVYDGDGFAKVDSEDDYGRIGNQAGSEHSPVVLGDYKVDEDAELERPERIALIDGAAEELELVGLPASYTFRSLGRGPEGEALVLGTDGTLHVIDPEEGEVTNGVELMDEWEEPLEWQKPRPALFVRGSTAYVSDSDANELHAVDLESLEVTVTQELKAAPNELSGVSAH